jgi:formylglycine-generating enzyme required for sulfatase activity
MARRFAPLLLLLGLSPSLDAKGPVEVKGREEEVLRLFVKELVVLTPGQGKFPRSLQMGSSGDAPATEKPPVEVTFPNDFAVSKYEVTQELYLVVMGNNPSRWEGPRNSVEMTSWDDAVTFCKKLTIELRKRGLIGEDEEVRLPSEAEWEYACRAGTTTRWYFGDSADDLGAHSWYRDNSKGHDPPVGQKKPNAWGLYDFHGYISEWCADSWHPTHEGADRTGKPRLDLESKDRVIRGGSFADPPEEHRSAFRSPKAIDFKSDRLGFRCVKAKVK